MCRSLSQVETRTKFLLSIASTDIFEVMGPISAIMSESAFNTNVCPEGVGSGSLLRDLGKSVTTLGSGSLHTQTFRLVQQQNGGGSEGVNLSQPTFYVRVWAANPAAHPVTVVRIG